MKMQLPIRTFVSGRFRIEAVSKSRGKRVLADFDDAPNIVTDWGLDRMGANSDYLARFHVGSGSSTPSELDTTLDSLVATSDGFVSDSENNTSSPPYYHTKTIQRSFSEGTATGNLTEVAAGIANTSGDYAFSRALILDGSGDPTTITVLSDEELRITYAIRLYPPTGDFSGTVNISGTDYDFLGRAAAVTSTSSWGFGTSSNGVSSASDGDMSSRGDQGGAGIGPITGGISGSASGLTDSQNGQDDPYVPGTLERGASWLFGTDVANFAGGIKAIQFSFNWCTWQFEFDTPIPKTSDDELTIEAQHSWGRYNSA